MIGSSLREMSAALAARKVSAAELATLFLDRAERLNPTLNAFVTTDRERTLAMALAADERRARGEAGPLLGVPLAHKDIFCTEGWLTTCG
jgi:aspartyl-tRNA(Asn)/glutamyl-tRNA(Gln) amidotransferase subunit A